jgi:AbrB family looped-hinge helix DNA binding protein
MDALASEVGHRGTIMLPAKLRRRIGIEEGSFVVAEERAERIVIRPATDSRSRSIRRSGGPNFSSIMR